MTIMKRMILTAAVAVAGMVSAQAQDANDTFIKIENENVFSHCFEMCDANGDGVVTYAEAAAATKLGLDRGGRSNVVENYAFLKYFPNLEAFSVGNTPLEEIDLSCLTKLKVVNVSSAMWLKKITVGGSVAPEITGEEVTGNKVEVVLKGAGGLTFQDASIKDFCLRNKVDANKDGEISAEEAQNVTSLSFMNFKSFIRNIKSYEDLQFFPNVERLHAGMTYLETVDVSACPKLKELDLSDCRMLKTIVLAKGCKPEIKYPVAYKGEKAKVVYK